LQADAPVMIILGTLVVVTSLATMHAILGNFGGSQFAESDPVFESYSNLHNEIEDQCSRLEEYDSVLSTTVNLNLINDAEIRYEDPDLVLEREDEDELAREVSCEMELDVEDSADIGTGNWEAEIDSDDDGDVIVEVTD